MCVSIKGSNSSKLVAKNFILIDSAIRFLNGFKQEKKNFIILILYVAYGVYCVFIHSFKNGIKNLSFFFRNVFIK